jgi:hypothetical protein
VYVEFLPGPDQELDDAAFEELADALDAAEQHLAGLGFSFPLRTSESLLAVKVSDTDDLSEERRATDALVAHLWSIFASRLTSQCPGTLSIKSMIGEVRCRESTSGTEMLDGPLLDVGTWSSASIGD